MIVKNKRGTERNIADTQLAEYQRRGYEPVEKAVEKPAEKPAEPVMRKPIESTSRSTRRSMER